MLVHSHLFASFVEVKKTVLWPLLGSFSTSKGDPQASNVGSSGEDSDVAPSSVAISDVWSEVGREMKSMSCPSCDERRECGEPKEGLH